MQLAATGTAPAGARDRILEAAEQLVAEQGASNLTLDAVAQAAGVSKGGLLYHFPSKDALLMGMLDRHCEQMDQRCAEAHADLPDNDFAGHLKAHVLGLLRWNTVRAEVGTAMFAAAANNPSLLENIRKRYADDIARMAEHPSAFARGAVVMLATDGLLMGEVWKLTSFTPEQREQIVAELLRLADEAFEKKPA